MTRKHLTYWALLSLILYLPLALWSGFPLWSVMLQAPCIALLLQRSALILIAQLKNPNRSCSDQLSPAVDKFIQNQECDLNKLPPCPHCQSESVAKMIYGKPALTRQIIDGLESGKIISGGCMVHSGAPEWHCNSCNRDFGHLLLTQPAPGGKA